MHVPCTYMYVSPRKYMYILHVHTCTCNYMLLLSVPQSNVPVPISAQAPITTIKDALPLLQTSQEQLIRTLTHSKMDVNSTGEAQNVTLLHRAAMVHVHMLICRLLFFPWLPSKPVYSTTGRILYTPSRHLMCTYVYT